MSKVCSRCHHSRPLPEFLHSPRHFGALIDHNVCNTCMRKQAGRCVWSHNTFQTLRCNGPNPARAALWESLSRSQTQAGRDAMKKESGATRAYAWPVVAEAATNPPPFPDLSQPAPAAPIVPPTTAAPAPATVAAPANFPVAVPVNVPLAIPANMLIAVPGLAPAQRCRQFNSNN